MLRHTRCRPRNAFPIEHEEILDGLQIDQLEPHSFTRAFIDNNAARGMESCNPAHAAKQSDFAEAERRSFSEPAWRRKARICTRESSSRGVSRSKSYFGELPLAKN
jgi:hypothetical protein